MKSKLCQNYANINHQSFIFPLYIRFFHNKHTLYPHSHYWHTLIVSIISTTSSVVRVHCFKFSFVICSFVLNTSFLQRENVLLDIIQLDFTSGNNGCTNIKYSALNKRKHLTQGLPKTAQEQTSHVHVDSAINNSKKK